MIARNPDDRQVIIVLSNQEDIFPEGIRLQMATIGLVE